MAGAVVKGLPMANENVSGSAESCFPHMNRLKMVYTKHTETEPE